MFSQSMPYPQRDAQAGKLLSDFLPDRIFDAHAHLFDTALLPALTGNCERLIGGWEKYREEMSTLLRAPRQLRINAIPYPDSQMADRQSGLLQKSNAFVLAELNKCPDSDGKRPGGGRSG